MCLPVHAGLHDRLDDLATAVKAPPLPRGRLCNSFHHDSIRFISNYYGYTISIMRSNMSFVISRHTKDYQRELGNF